MAHRRGGRDGRHDAAVKKHVSEMEKGMAPGQNPANGNPSYQREPFNPNLGIKPQSNAAALENILVKKDPTK